MAFYFMPCKHPQIAPSRDPPSGTHAAAMAASRSAAAADTVVPGVDGWARRLRRHLRWVIAIKLLLIYLLFSLFFSSPQRPVVDAARVSDRLQLNR